MIKVDESDAMQVDVREKNFRRAMVLRVILYTLDRPSSRVAPPLEIVSYRATSPLSNSTSPILVSVVTVNGLVAFEKAGGTEWTKVRRII